ncbi:MAG: TldD/PmbA family protein [Candidatus Marinimicrobia bacterium]|nr:TldD/PmbA family protein [Candidatus Neomarinimicrobiota bacterium]
MSQYKEIAEFIIKEARKNGADQVDVMIVNRTNASITVRLGEIEEVKQASPESLGIRVFKNKRKALTYTSDFRKDSLKKLVKRTTEMANVTTSDEYNGLPERNLLGIASKILPQFDKNIESISTAQKIRMLKDMEKIGMEKDPLISNSDGAGWHDSESHVILANSEGFYGEEDYTSFSLSLSLLAEKDNVKQIDYWYSASRFFDRLDSIESIASKAAERTLRKLGSRKPKTQKVPVVFDPIVGRDFLSIIARTVVGDAIYNKNSFLVDQLNKKIAVDQLTVIDDGLLEYGLGSRRFDDEGLPSRKNVVIDKGMLKTYLCDCYSARKLNQPTTGSASRGVSSNPSSSTSNFFMQNGTIPPEEIIASVKDGLYLTSVDWVGINYVTGDYSRGATGIWIKEGKLAYPVQEFTVASNMLKMMKNISMIGNDLEFRASIATPTFKIDEMMISGS